MSQHPNNPHVKAYRERHKGERFATYIAPSAHAAIDVIAGQLGLTKKAAVEHALAATAASLLRKHNA